MSPAIPVQLYHYTCGQHGRPGIEVAKTVCPAPQPLLRKNLAWFTDLALPDRWALGLTNSSLCCDRTEYRVTVNTPGTTVVPWWHWCRGVVQPVLREILELEGLCMHWWVSEAPVIAREIVETATLYPQRTGS